MLASTALRDLIVGPARAARILGTSRQATWASVGEQVVVVTGPDAVRFPNGVVVNDLPAADGFRVGDGALALGGRRIVVSRWWDPRPVLPTTDREQLERGVAVLARRVEPTSDRALGEALARRDPAAVIEVAKGLLGRGPGLTPSGDDVLAGAFAAFLHLGAAVGDPGAAPLTASLRPALHRVAARGTTVLSAALIDHAFVGQVALPVARLLRGLTGRGSIDDAVDALLVVGHSSGPALAEGVLAGATAVCGRRR